MKHIIYLIIDNLQRKCGEIKMKLIGQKVGRQTFKVAIELALRRTNKERQKAMLQFIGLAEKKLGDVWKQESYDQLRSIFKDKDSKWMQFTNHLLDDIDPKVVKMAALNLGYEAGFKGYHTAQANSEKYDCNIPWIILFDPTSACNLHCTGCWASEYGNRLNLSYEDMDNVITQAEELGTHAFLMTGGEPLVRKDDIIRLCEKHKKSEFQIFTNGTLIDDAFCKEMLRVGNLMVSVSIEGFEKENDGRRGKGVYQKVLHAMDLMRENKLLFGTSICYTSQNYKTVTSDEFLDLLIEKGASFIWYFHYMPVGNDASVDLLLNPEQREYMYHRVREIRGLEGGKPIFAIDFQNDGDRVGGCIAGGKYYCHINSNGDVEPCVFIHYSNANIHEKTWLECLQQPLFRAYRKNQPFNENMLQPCPMLENPEILERMVKETGAISTDLESPETCEHLCGKCHHYAKEWQPTAEKLFEEQSKDKC